MTPQPIINIDKFAGSGESGILFNEGFYPEIDNGKSVMGEGFSNLTLVNTATTGFSTLGIVMSILGLKKISNRNIYSLILNSGGNIYSKSSETGGVVDKLVHSNTQSSTDYPCMLETSNGNILYTSLNDIGRGVRGKVSSGSTTTLVDTTKDFVTLGYVAGDKVTNLTTGIEYAITVVATTTLTFVANGTNTNSANDEYIVWEDDRFDIDMSTTLASWQPAITAWNKQIKQYGTQYLFGNGNYLGIISAAESTVDTTYKQLPAKHQLLAFDINVSMILISAEFNGKGVLCLWDGYSDGFNNLLELDSPVKALLKYKSGWTYILNGVIYYTDGFQITKLSDLNSTSILDQSNINPVMYNSLTIYRGLLYCASQPGNQINLLRNGVYTIDLENPQKGWTLIKCKKTTRNNGIPYSLFLTNRFETYQQILVGGEGFVDYLRISADVQYSNKSLLMYVNLPASQKISGIGLNLSRYLKEYNNDTYVQSRVIQVSIGDGNRGLISRVYGTGVTTSTLTVNGTAYLNNEVDDEIIVSQYDDATYDERAFVTSIVDKGTSSEDWTISPALSDTLDTSSELRMMRLKKCDSVTINYNDLKKEYWFASSGLETNKLFIEIVFYGQTNAMPLNITNIKVYGN